MKTHFIHKYKSTHEKRRKLFLRWFNQRKVELIKDDYHGWLFIELDNHPITCTGLGRSRNYSMRRNRS